MNHFSTNIKLLREARNLSQEALAEELKTSRQSIGGWESGRFEPQICMVIKVADFFEVSVDALVKRRVMEHINTGHYITKFDHDNEIFLGN